MRNGNTSTGHPYVSTAALTLMPLLLIGGFAFWISRAYAAKAARRRHKPATSMQSAIDR